MTTTITIHTAKPCINKKNYQRGLSDITSKLQYTSMALKALSMMVVIVAMAAAAPALATDYTVGDDAGWKTDFNYSAWAEGKQFRVGDTLEFEYAPGKHNVLKVSGADFKACTSSNASAVPLMSGNDKITLSTTGKKWYICDIADHCTRGMKLVVSVDVGSTAPGASAAVDLSPMWVVAVAAAYRMIMAA